MAESKQDPKAEYGTQKTSTSAIPASAILLLGAAMETGAEKYGRLNWRSTDIDPLVYFSALMRHLLAWLDGYERDEESGLPHLAHVMACCAILLDNDSVKRGEYAPEIMAALSHKRKTGNEPQ